jgi:hypothetical protein
MSSNLESTVQDHRLNGASVRLKTLLNGALLPFPVVCLSNLQCNAVVLSQGDRSVDVMTVDGMVRAVFFDDRAEEITDPARQAVLLRRALRTVRALSETARQQLTQARAEHAQQLRRSAPT